VNQGVAQKKFSFQKSFFFEKKQKLGKKIFFWVWPMKQWNNRTIEFFFEKSKFEKINFEKKYFGKNIFFKKFFLKKNVFKKKHFGKKKFFFKKFPKVRSKMDFGPGGHLRFRLTNELTN